MTSTAELPYKVVISAEDSQIAFDACISEQHNSKATVTSHPIERGADVTDHVQQDPDGLVLNGIISDTPILLNVETDLEPSVPGTDPQRRAHAAYKEFRRLKEAASLLEVTTELHDYADMVITAISVTRDKTKRFILDIGLTLTPIRKVKTESVDAPEPRDPVHKARRKGGQKPKSKPKTAVEQKGESLFEDIANALDVGF